MNINFKTNINAKELYEFTLNHNYKSLHGILGVAFSLASAVGAVWFWDKFTPTNRVIIILLALMFTVFEPLGCYIKVRKQIKKNFTKPLEYVFDDEGIEVSQGESSSRVNWNEIMKVTSTKNLINIYTSPLMAFIIPKKDAGQHMDSLKEMLTTKAQCRRIVIK